MPHCSLLAALLPNGRSRPTAISAKRCSHHQLCRHSLSGMRLCCSRLSTLRVTVLEPLSAKTSSYNAAMCLIFLRFLFIKQICFKVFFLVRNRLNVTRLSSFANFAFPCARKIIFWSCIANKGSEIRLHPPLRVLQAFWFPVDEVSLP